MKALQMPELTEEQQGELAEVYRRTKDVRIRTRAQMVLLACEQHHSAPAIAAIVREDDETVRRWLKRYLEKGIEGGAGEASWSGASAAHDVSNLRKIL